MKKTIINKSADERYICYNEVLGRGSFKVVYRGYDTHMGKDIAWNSINVNNLSEKNIKSSMNEIKLLQEISPNNNNIIDLFDSWIDCENTEVYIIMITEIALSGTLLDVR